MAVDITCKGKNASGGICGARPQPGLKYCQWHDPAREEERAQWRREGGKARSHARRAARELEAQSAQMSDLKGALFRALRRVEKGQLEPDVAHSMATLSRAIVAVNQAHELEERLTALEARAGISQGVA